MENEIPSQCPEGSKITVVVSSVPPEKHERGPGWMTRAECEHCGRFLGWFE